MLDSRIGRFKSLARTRFSATNKTKNVEVLVGTENRVHIWELARTEQKKLTDLGLESSKTLFFNDRHIFEAHLDANIQASGSERIGSVRWNGDKQEFVISTRENSVRLFGLEQADDAELWVLKVCSFSMIVFLTLVVVVPLHNICELSA